MTHSNTSSVPTLFSKVRGVYEFLLEEDNMAIHGMMRHSHTHCLRDPPLCTLHQGLFRNEKLMYVTNYSICNIV